MRLPGNTENTGAEDSGLMATRVGNHPPSGSAQDFGAWRQPMEGRDPYVSGGLRVSSQLNILLL